VLAAVEQPGRRAVFNLSVMGQPEFFANGVLVHNCDAGRYGWETGRQSWWYDVYPEELEAELEMAASGAPLTVLG